LTATDRPGSQNRRRGKQTGALSTRRLARVTLRQHQTALLWTGIAVAVLAIALAATGIAVRELAARGGPFWYGATRASVDYGGAVLWAFVLTLSLLPLIAGMFLGAPLLPREFDNGTAKLAWTQAASRTKWLVGQVLPLASLLVLAALAIGAEFAWWLAPFPSNRGIGFINSWFLGWPLRFNLSPLLLAGWAVFAFTLGICLGAAIRQTLAAMAATIVGYAAALYEVTTWWQVQDILPGSGFRHLKMWLTWMPVRRYLTLELINLGWLLAASALLVAAAIFLIRRLPA
jgi:hypothetical protein